MKFELLIDEFNEYGYLRDKQPNTMKSYIESAQALKKYIQKDITTCTEDDILRFQKHLSENKGLKTSTINIRIRGLRYFFGFLMDKEYITKNPIVKVKTKKDPRQKTINFIEQHELASIIEKIDQEIKSEDDFAKKARLIRDGALIKVLAFSGLRIGEVNNLKICDIVFVDNAIKVVNDAERRNKTYKDRTVIVDNSCIEAIKKYLKVRSYFVNQKDQKDTGYIFYTNQGNRMNERNAIDICHRIAKKAGVDDYTKITPHTFRHTFASIIYSKTKDLLYVKELLGHQSIKTTEIYAHVLNKSNNTALSINDILSNDDNISYISEYGKIS